MAGRTLICCAYGCFIIESEPEPAKWVHSSIATRTARFSGIDRYLKEGATSAAQGFQCHREDRAPHSQEMALQLL